MQSATAATALSIVDFVTFFINYLMLLCVQKLYVRLNDKDEEFKCQLLIP